MYSWITSRYPGIELDDWQTHDLLDGEDYVLNEDGTLVPAENNTHPDAMSDILATKYIDIIGGKRDAFREYRLTLDDGRVTLVEDLDDEAYWKEKYRLEYKALPWREKLRAQWYRAQFWYRWTFHRKAEEKRFAEAFAIPVMAVCTPTLIAMRLAEIESMPVEPPPPSTGEILCWGQDKEPDQI